jgi:predicted AAA+ superfamily ATPase
VLNPPPLDDPEGEDDITDVKPKILLFGLRRSGKTSIRKVVFHKMSANETIFLESTTKVRIFLIDSIIFDHLDLSDSDQMLIDITPGSFSKSVAHV